MTYSISGETSGRVYSNWIIEAKNKKQAERLFLDKVSKLRKRFRTLVIKERGQEKI